MKSGIARSFWHTMRVHDQIISDQTRTKSTDLIEGELKVSEGE